MPIDSMPPAARRARSFVLFAAATLLAAAAHAADVPVSTAAQLQTAIANAQPGHRIVLAPGLYQPAPVKITASANGTSQSPIDVTAEVPGSVTIRFGAGDAGIVEGFLVRGRHWRFSNLVLEGACTNDSNCEHAFHVVGDADNVTIRGNTLRNFNAQIKANGESGLFPDDLLIENNVFLDTARRATANPVTKIDIVGGSRTVIRANAISDFSKNGGDTISYGAFLKGGSVDGVMERNLVTCAKNHTGGVRIGLSLGGGGTSPDSICQGGSCTPEHRNGIIRNNLILSCTDVGVYINEGENTRVLHNTLYATTGIDFRFPESTGSASGNILSGTIRNRNGGTHVAGTNLLNVSTATFATWFVNPAQADFRLIGTPAFVNAIAAPNPLVPADYCGNARDDGQPDLGALEYDDDFGCRTETAGGLSVDALFANGFEP